MVLQFRYVHNALEYLVQKYAIRQMYIPYYLCSVVRHTLVMGNCKPIFYHIDDNLFPLNIFEQENFILYPNYFGICDKNIEQLAKEYPKLIVDNAHAYYSKPQGFACFNSAYKFGIGDYANLWIEGDLSPVNFDNGILQKRKNKFLQLHELYGESNLLNIDTSSIPFCYPYLAATIEEADRLVQDLQSQGLTIYRYWSSLPKSYNEYKFYSRLVPIPICL